MPADLFLAWKYFKPKRSAVSVITLISVIGVGLGVGVLIVVLAVMTGFTDKMKEKLLDTTAHAQAYPDGGGWTTDTSPVLKSAKSAGGEGLPVVLSPVLLQRGSRFLPKQLFAFDSSGASEKRIQLKAAVIEGEFSLEHGDVLISYLTARETGANVGDKLLIHAPNKLSKLVSKNSDGRLAASDSAYLPGEYRVAGIFKFGKYDFDKNFIFLGLDDADELFGIPLGAATAVFLWTDDPYSMDGFLKKINSEVRGWTVYSWKDMNRQLLGVLSVEKNMQFFLLAFIVLVAAFSITNTLITTVIQKTREIGLLKALGASSGSVMRIFIMQGLFVGILGTALGIVLGCLVVHYRMAVLGFLRTVTGQEIFPAEIYAFSELPAHIVVSDIVCIAAISVLLCTLGGVIPAFRAARLDPASALRSE